ncbi:MAG: hypothetical protein J6X84_01235 [Treponema sp.]|nr:hypothetical protein [Treponema sp.]
MIKKMKNIFKILLVITGCLLFASFSPSLDGRAVVVDKGVFPEGLFAKTVGYLPGDIITVTNISGDHTVDLLVIGALDPSEGVAIMLSPEAADAMGIDKGANNIVKITKRSGQDERVYGNAVISKSNSALDDYDDNFDSIGSEKNTDAFAESEKEAENNAEPQPTVEPESEAQPEVEAEPEPTPAFVEPEKPAAQEVEETPAKEEPPVAEETAASEPVEEEAVEAEPLEETLEPAQESEPANQTEEEQTPIPVEQETEEESEPEETVAEEIDEVPAETESPESYETFEDDEPEQPEAESENEEPFAAEELDELENQEEGEAESVEEIEEPETPEPEKEEAPAETFEEDSIDELPQEDDEVTEALEEESPADEALEEETESYEAIVLVPAESNPPEDEVSEVEENVTPAEEAKIEEPKEEEPSVEVVEKPAPSSASSYQNYVVPNLSSLQKGKYYIQIAVYSSDENIMAVIEKYGTNYPITIVPMAGGVKKQILIGPVNVDEYKVVLERFKSYGFKDAFLRKVR